MFRAALSLLLVAALGVAACGNPPPPEVVPDAGTEPPPPPPPPEPLIDLRADVNRDGVVDVTGASDEEGEEGWTAERGAVFLANIDDDQKSCATTDSFGRPLSDTALAQCNDAADELVNGDADLLDMAQLRTVPWPEAPDGTWVQLSVTSWTWVRLFRKESDGTWLMVKANDLLGAEQLRAGIELRLEARDIVRNPAEWDGRVTVTIRSAGTLSDGRGFDETDKVLLRVSPVMTFHHLLKAETVSVTRIPRDSESSEFVSALKTNLTGAGVANPLVEVRDEDPWTQDFYETGYMSMPGEGGKQHVIRVSYRSANLYDPRPTSNFPLRSAGRVVFEQFRGPDSAGIQHFDRDANLDFDTLNSFGNTETIPPYTLGEARYPLGRLLRGSAADYHPDALFTKMLEAQGQQPPVYVDTSWLMVAHVDETVSFLAANNPRGWVVLVNDARLAKKMLEDALAAGHGDVPLFDGRQWMDDFGNEYSAKVTIAELLADTEVMAASNRAAIEVDAQLAVLEREAGLTDEEIIRVPFLHHEFDGYSVAYQPGTVNMLVLDDKNVVVPDPWGPVIDGKDLFKDQLEKTLGELGYRIWWQDDWNLYHRMLGEVHCGTNAVRSIPDVRWWESGR